MSATTILIEFEMLPLPIDLYAAKSRLLMVSNVIRSEIELVKCVLNMLYIVVSLLHR